MRYNSILKPCKLLQQHHALPLGEGVLNKVLYRNAVPRGPTPYPLKYYFDTERTPFVYLHLRTKYMYGTGPFTYLV